MKPLTEKELCAIEKRHPRDRQIARLALEVRQLRQEWIQLQADPKLMGRIKNAKCKMQKRRAARTRNF